MKKMKITVSLRECGKFHEAIMDCQLSNQLQSESSDVWMSDELEDDEWDDLFCDVEDQLQMWGVSEYEVEEIGVGGDEDEECEFLDLDPGFSSWADYNRYKFG